MTPGRHLAWWLLAAVAGGVIVAASLLLDPAVQNWMRANQTRGFRSFMQSVSYIGDWVGHAVAAVIGAFVAYRRQNRRWVRIFMAMLIALAIAGTVARVVKVAAGRSRPSVQVDVGFNGPRWTAKYHAFPSGHTASTMAYFGVLAFANVRLFAVLLPIPLLIGFARLYVGAHHFSDVIAGALIGIAIAVLVAHWPRLQIARREPAIAD